MVIGQVQCPFRILLESSRSVNKGVSCMSQKCKDHRFIESCPRFDLISKGFEAESTVVRESINDLTIEESTPVLEGLRKVPMEKSNLEIILMEGEAFN